MLLSHPILRLVGPSGIGKSSLIRAGLLPKIREFGWRACVIRPFENPAQRVPPQLTAQLLTSPGAFTKPLDTAKFRANVAPLLSSNGINRLVLFLDQFEDIVSPMAAPGAVDAIREFLWELWEQKEAKPSLRAVVVYRTDADARLGRLWQEISAKSEGLPYFALQGLSRNVAEDIINQTAREQGWRLETSVPEIARQLTLESQKLDCYDEVFPVYLQIFLKQAEQNPGGRITGEFITSLGGVSGLIGKYLEQTLGRLKARGGEWQQCGAVLESLSRSTGAKAAQSLDDLVRETGVSRAVLAEILRELINERLVRPVGHETYEIQHDRLAAAVIESMKVSDREAKAAGEFLAAKVPVFESTMVSLRPDELIYLYRHRRKIHPTERELQLLLASIYDRIDAGYRIESPVAYWFNESSPQDFLRWFIQIEHWAPKERSIERIFLGRSHAWAETFPLCGLESQFAALAADPVPSVRAICAQWIGRTKRDDDLPLLGELALDRDTDVRLAAVKALASLAQAENLPLLRKLVEGHMNVRAKVARFARTEDPLSMLKLVKTLGRYSNMLVRREALRALASFAQAEDLPLLRKLAAGGYRGVGVKSDRSLRLVVVKALARFSRAEDLPLFRKLAKGLDSKVRVEAVKALASFSKKEDLPLLLKLARDPDRHLAAVKALTSFSKEDDLPLLRKLANDQNWNVRLAAAKALASFSQVEALLLLRKLANDKDDSNVRLEVGKALARFSQEEALPLLRKLALTPNNNVAAEAIRAMASHCSREELEALLNRHDQELCAGALAALDEVLYMPEWMRQITI